MKLNGKNIISDADVTVLHQNSTLADVIKQQSTDIDRLKSNVKWLYKYGGVGSGSGGGGNGGGSGVWYAVININGTTFTATPSETGNTQTGNLIVNGAGRYPIDIQIIRPRGGTFNAKISYFSGNTVTVNDKLNEDNAWTIKRNINITSNNQISVSITDGEYMAILKVDYITSPYYLTLKLCNNDGTLEYAGSIDKMVDDIKANGLKAKLEYDIGVEVAKDDAGNYNGVTYRVTDIKGNIKEPQVLDLSEGMKGVLYLPLCDDADTFLTNNANSATYTFKLEVTIVTDAGGLSSTETFYSTFTLIPSDLYLKVVPDVGTIYPIRQTVNDGTYIYGAGTKSFNVTPFFGVLTGKTIIVSAYIDKTADEIKADLLLPPEDRTITPVMESTSVTERKTISGITINISSDNADYTEHILVFRATCAETVAYFTYYIYARLLNSNLLWYPLKNNIVKKPDFQAYWHDNNDYLRIKLTDSMVYTQTASSTQKEFGITYAQTVSAGADMLFSVGILYSEINDDESPILAITRNDGGQPGSDDFITIFPKYITLGGRIGIGTKLSCYIPKTPYNKYNTASKEYHLITIYKRRIYNPHNNGSTDKIYEICVYIDGVLEGTFPDWNVNQPTYAKIVLCPANYYINHIELSHYNAQMNAEEHSNYMSDANIVRYWYTYATQRLDRVDVPYVTLTSYEEGISLLQDSEYLNIPKILSQSLDGIVQNSKVPVLNFQVTDGETFDKKFLYWYTRRYTEAESINKIPCQLQYATAEETSLTDIDVNNAQFHIEIQGSTTRGYRCKNFELCITPTSEDPITTYLFSPNFDPNKFDSFLPEASFTLKADAVDSSHSNNTTMGDFINKAEYVKDLFNDMTNDNCQTGSYTKHVKKCLCGFACLVFVTVTPYGNSGPASIYYLGIYNFNLGRKSIFNLGYSDTKNLDSCIETVNGQSGLQKGFHVYSIPIEKTKKIDTFFCAEISGNSIYYDFSQFHQSILFPIDDTDKDGMFGDIVTELPSGEYIGMVQKFVRSVAGTGQWIYRRLCKNFGPYSSAYEEVDPTTKVSVNSVPDNTIQYIRDIKSGTSQFTPDSNTTFNITTAGNNSTEFNLCINPFADQYRNNGETPDLDYTSVVQYYTICMIFGLFDSVMKNLQIRTWNKKRFYIAFYDMDTCLGVDNAGNDADYFAFSDYWDAAYTEIEHGDITALRPKDVVVYRDFKKPGVKGFDIASSYLFAIAKYAKLFEEDLQNEEGTGPIELTDYPVYLWAKWRMRGGELETADKFIKKYYQHHLEDVDECSLNYNYRSKYFSFGGINETGNVVYNSTDIGKFKGRRLEYVRQWLTGRFHIMDAYFNVASVLQPFTKYDKATHETSPVYLREGTDTVIMEPRLKDNDIPNSNDDVYVLHSMFSEQQRFSGKLDMYVKALPYSPLLIIPSGGNPITMLLFDSGTMYNIYKDGAGFNAVNLGGSKSWTYLEHINNLAGNCLVNAPNLKNLTGTSSADAEISSWTLNTPSIETISLTSSKYSGTMTLNGDQNAMPNLTDINLSNTGMSLEINKMPSLKHIIKKNSKNGALNIQNCNNIQSLDISGSFTSITLTNFKLNVNWTEVKSTSVDITADDTVIPNFKMYNNNTVETVSLSGFATVDIKYCNKLKNITIAGGKTTSVTISGNAERHSLKELSISGSKLKTLHVSNMNGSGNLTTIKFIEADPLNLTSLNIRVTPIETFTYHNAAYNNEASAFSTTVCGGNPVLWLWPLQKLSSIACDNCSVKYIQFFNPAPGSNGGRWNVINLTNNFKNTNIRRIFGTFAIKCNECFRQLGSNFTIHGPKPAANATIPKFNNQPMWSNDTNRTRAVPIWEIMNDRDNSKPVDINRLYRSGQGVTNMTIGQNNCTRMFYGTHLPEFDIYYLLYNIGSGENLTDCFRCEGTYARSTPIWSYADSRNINRFAFRKLTNVTSISWLFRGSGGKIAVASPKLNEDGSVTPGLFTPLASHLSGTYYSINYDWQIIDRNIFRTFSPNIKFDKLANIEYVNTSVIANDINEYLDYNGQRLVKSIPRNSTDSTKFGNIEGIFDDLPNLIGLHRSFCNCDYINWTRDFRFPPKITNITGSMYASVVSGEFAFPDYFPSTGSTHHPIQSIVGSFRCNNIVDHDSRRCVMKLSDSFFSNTPNLQRFGCVSIANTLTDATPGFEKLDVPDGITAGTFIGFKKEYDEYPADILSPCKHLIQCGSLFEGMKLSETVINPCSIFKNAPTLQNIDGTFYNFYASLDLDNQSPFALLPNLQTVNYLFARTDTLRLTKGEIRNLGLKFFYHGHSEVNTTLYGCYEADITTTVDPSTNKATTVYPATPKQIKLSYKKYRQNISQMYMVFSGCDINTFQHLLSANDFETNPAYNPFDYVYNTNTKKWSRNTSKDTRQYMFYYFFDGDSGTNSLDEMCQLVKPGTTSANFVIPEDLRIAQCAVSICEHSNLVQPGVRENSMDITKFFCPPDLFRYSSPNCNINRAFLNCGKKKMYHYQGTLETSTPFRTFGTKGRICPWLLQGLTSITRTYEMFKNCKALCSYNRYKIDESGSEVVENDKAYFIPPSFFTYAKNVTNLTGMFEGTYMSANTKLNDVFKPLTGSLIINRIFYETFKPCTVSNVFSTNTIQSLSEAFAVGTNNNGNTLYNQTVTFEQVFKAGYTNKTSPLENWSRCFFGYKNNNPATCTHENPKTLNYNTYYTQNYNFGIITS